MDIDNNEIELLNTIFNSSFDNTMIDTLENVNTIITKEKETVENTIDTITKNIDTTIDTTIENTIDTTIDTITKTIETKMNNNVVGSYINKLHKLHKFNTSDNETETEHNSDNENNNMVRFKNMSLNEIKTLDTFNNSLTLPSENSTISESDYSYTQTVKSPTTNYNKPTKHIRSIKSQKQVDGIEEIDYVYNKLQDYVRYMNINRTNYVIIICKAIEIIENYKELKNSNNKKHIVFKSLNRIISLDLELCDFDKYLFIITINNLIELIISCTKITGANTIIKQKHIFDDDIILAKSGQIIHSLIDKLTTIVVKKHYCIEKILVNITTLTHILMILVDKYIYLSGLEKKIIVIQSINSFIKDRLQFIMEIDNDKIEPLNLSLDTVPIVIDLLISLKKGKYKINIKNEVYTHKINKHFFSLKKKNKNNNNILENYVY